MPGTARISSSCSTAWRFSIISTTTISSSARDVVRGRGLVPVAHPSVGGAVECRRRSGVSGRTVRTQARASSAVRTSANRTAWKPAPTARWASHVRGSWSSLIIAPEPVQLGRPAEVVEPVQVVRRVLARELDVVVLAGMADDLDDRRPGRVDVRADRRPARPEQLAQPVRTHGPTATGGRSGRSRRTVRRPRARRSSARPGVR